MKLSLSVEIIEILPEEELPRSPSLRERVLLQTHFGRCSAIQCTFTALSLLSESV